MTTIVYRNGVMACDSRAYSGGSMPIGSKSKIERLDDGTLLGVSSTIPGGAEAIRQWYKDGMPKDCNYNLPDRFSLLVAKLNGSIFMANDNLMISGPLMGEYFAIGSGSEYALGAMAAGLGPEQAVKIACELDVWSSEPIFALTHSGNSEYIAK